jgi:hypothetical protein
MLGSVGGSNGGTVDLLLAAGGTVSSANGGPLNLGVIGGAEPSSSAECAATAPPPSPVEIPAPDFSSGPAGHHVAVAVGEHYLNQAGWAMHQSGGLCLSADRSQVTFLETGLFKTILPSLGMLTTRDGQDAPMMLVITPGKPPTFKIGAGTVDPATNLPIDPLIEIGLNDFAMDFYALMDDRYARLFRMNADVKLAFSLQTMGCKLVPALGDLKNLIVVKSTTDSEMLAEDGTQVEQLIPVAISVAGPSLASALSNISLPNLGGFQMKVSSAQGITPKPAGGGFHHLGLFIELVPNGQPCETMTSAPFVWQQDKGAPPPTGGSGARFSFPTVRLGVRANGAKEFAYRINGGIWSRFAPLASSGLIDVSHPLLMLSGKHRVEVVTRSDEGLSEPAVLDVDLADAPRGL